MRPEDKIINIIRNMLMEEYKEEFLELSEKDQNELIAKTIIDYIKGAHD